MVLGAHLEATRKGHALSVEVVQRQAGDAGGCVATVDGRAIIVEDFRLPAGTDLGRYPHFNTNNLWISLTALRVPAALQWFPIRRSIRWPDGQLSEVVQFERLGYFAHDAEQPGLFHRTVGLKDEWANLQKARTT